MVAPLQMSTDITGTWFDWEYFHLCWSFVIFLILKPGASFVKHLLRFVLELSLVIISNSVDAKQKKTGSKNPIVTFAPGINKYHISLNWRLMSSKFPLYNASTNKSFKRKSHGPEEKILLGDKTTTSVEEIEAGQHVLFCWLLNGLTNKAEQAAWEFLLLLQWMKKSRTTELWLMIKRKVLTFNYKVKKT